MKGNKIDRHVNRSLFSIKNYLIFFLLISGVVTSCFLIFFWGLEIPEQIVSRSAPKTFIAVILLSFFCCLVDSLRRKYSVERPVKQILDATQQIIRGNYKIYIKPLHSSNSRNEFDIIIDNINKMARELSGTETLRTDFVANVSHELKTPLAVIQNYSSMMKDPTLSQDLRLEYAKTVAEASHRLADLITNILRLNKLENQQFFAELSAYNLGEQLCECLLNFESLWEEKQLKIETDITEDVIVEADRELLTLVWNNLFSNAVKFTGQQGCVSVRLAVEKNFAVVKVSDTGCGISSEIGKHIFEKFYQGDTSHAIQGNGLGLALVRRVLDITGGEISIESELGKGSTFVVKIARNSDGFI